jgi:Fe-S-cluster containining protein
MGSSKQIKQQAAEDRKLFTQLKSRKPRDLDAVVHRLHDEAFSRIDCLDCANCCKTTGPLFIDRDIERLSKYLGISRKEFVAQYLRVDEDGDMVLQSVPCPFLEPDNKCRVYDYRPQACATYPHTDRVKQHQILHLMEQNTAVCPAVRDIVDRLKAVYQK